jgi:hypothetical protein
VAKAGTFRFWPQGGLAGPIARAALLGDDQTLSNWGAATEVVVGLGRIVALCYRSPTSYQIS